MTGRADPADYLEIDLRAHSLLADVPLHDVWCVDLPGPAHGRTLADLRGTLSPERIAQEHRAVALLFRLRAWLGRALSLDREPRGASHSSFASRLSAEDRERSLVAAGTRDGPFQLLYATDHESISEVQNATVHAFSVMALVERGDGRRLYWGIYVRPVGRITRWYMRLIDPFRRLVVYPALLGRIRAAWERDVLPETAG